MSTHFLAFEKPIVELNERIDALVAFKQNSQQPDIDFDEEIKLLEKKCLALTKKIFSQLGAWEIVQLAKASIEALYPRLYFADFYGISGVGWR